MSSAIGELPPETMLVPVPLHRNRAYERGYNQSSLLAGLLSDDFGLPLAEDLMIRIRPTRAQMSLPLAERRANVRGAFAAAPGVQIPKRVLMVDDVVTTGSTVDECARVLTTVGIDRVTVAAVARAV